MDHTPTLEELRQLSDAQLADLAWRVQAEQQRRRKLRQPPSFVDDIRAAINRHQAQEDRGGDRA